MIHATATFPPESSPPTLLIRSIAVNRSSLSKLIKNSVTGNPLNTSVLARNEEIQGGSSVRLMPPPQDKM
ncbi:unnamed protein product [Penicillium palitans]|uniref:Uncharacterized protein n=1 Tax=Penicillium nordicum TaxID=229535 RepID=A0A0M9WFF8_9EURO|nr:hypothetical protein ACN38_g6299 [Penicillium nordicum]